MVTLCVPTLNRYDLLARCIDSARKGSMIPDRFLVVDNGRTLKAEDSLVGVDIYTPEVNLGVAGSWNWLVKNSEGIRIIVNDDIEFCNDTIEKMVVTLQEGHPFVCTSRPFGVLNGFSCFAIDDRIIEAVGYFDDTISPNYAYFEDNDYHRRMILAGYGIVESGAEAIHVGSATIKAMDPEQMRQHHLRFVLAQQNYTRKWGGLPGNETFTTPYGG